MSVQFKTTTTVMGQQQVDEFDALCALLGRRRHELASDMVLDALRAYRNDPAVAPLVQALLRNRRAYQREQNGTALRVVKDGDRP